MASKLLALALLLLPVSVFAGNATIQDENVKSYSDLKVSANAITGNLSSGTPCIASPSSTMRISVGQFVYDLTSPAKIPAGTTVAALPGTCSAGQIKLSANATAGATGDSIGFGGQLSQLVHSSKIYDEFNNQPLSDTIANGQIGKTVPGVTYLTSGSGTYTTPSSPAPLYLRVRLVGGGGGGGGTISGGTGGTGGTTTFGTSFLTATGGTGGNGSGSSPGVGGSATIVGPTGLTLHGGSGQGGGNTDSSGDFNPGGNGGNSALGGAGGGSPKNTSGGDAAVNSGSGGGGAGGSGVNGSTSGAGGGAGGYLDVIVASPAASYSYTVGALGAGGTLASGGRTGGDGGSGIIIVEAHYQ